MLRTKNFVSAEACRIGIDMQPDGKVDVGAPMKHKDLCYNMLKDAVTVIDRTPDHMFRRGVRTMAVVMDMSGRVDVGAPLPHRELALLMIARAREVIQRYGEAQDVIVKPFARAVLGETASAD